jgi:hypothetical protein
LLGRDADGADAEKNADSTWLNWVSTGSETA